MSFTSRTIKRKDAFSQELSTVIGQRSIVTTTTTSSEERNITIIRSGQTFASSPIDIEEVSDLYSVVKDFTADDENAISLRQGELVEVLDIGSSAAKRLKLDIGGDPGELLDVSAAKHKLSIRPKRKHADPRQRDTSPLPEQVRWLVRTVEGVSKQGWIPSNILKLESPTYEEHHRPEDAKYKREAVVRELVETEEEFGRDLQTVVESYMKPLDSSSVPRIVRDNIDVIFSNLRQIANFHNTVLIEGVKYYANEPRMIGKTFLRLERDFDKHVAYCRDEPAAQEFLADNPPAKDFFEELSQRIGDDKSLSEHLKLPIQRINDYQLLLKELVKYSARLGEPTDDLKRALELMLAVPHRANDNKFISNIEGFHGNIHKLGRLLRHDWFTVTDKDNKSKERYLFLFKARILICKVKRISEDRSVFVLKDIIRLPEVEIRDLQDDWTFELNHKEPNFANFPLRVTAHKEDVKSAWLKEIRKYASDALALQEHAADDLRISEDSHLKENTDPASLLRAQLEARLHKVAKKIETEQSQTTTEELIKSGEQSFALKEQAQISQQSSIPLTVQEKVTQNQVQESSKSAQVPQVQTQPAKSEAQPKESKNLPQEATAAKVSEVQKPPAEQKPAEKVPETVSAPEEPSRKPSVVATPPSTKQPEPTQPSKPSETAVVQSPPTPKQAESLPQTKLPESQLKEKEVSQVPSQPKPTEETKPVEPKSVEVSKTAEAPPKPTEAPSKPKAPDTPSKPTETLPTQAKAAEATPKSAEAPAKAKPTEAPTTQAKPAEVPKQAPKPAETPQIQEKPAEAKVPTVETKPAEVLSKPVEAPPKPTDAQLPEAKAPEASPKSKPAEVPSKTTETPPAQQKPAEVPSKPKEAPQAQAKTKPVEAPPAQQKPPEVPSKPTEVPQTPAKPAEAPPAQQKTAEAPPTQQKPVETPPPQPKPAEAPAAQAKPAEASPAPTKPAEVPAAQPKPAEAPVAQPKPVEAPPAKPKPVETPPFQPKPAEAPAAQPKPAEASPAPAKPTPAKPAEVPAAQPKPAEAPVVQPKPVEAPPAKPKPVEAPPAQPKPAETVKKAAEVAQQPKPQQNPGVTQQKPSEPANQPPPEGGVKRPAPDEPLVEKKQKSDDMSGISSRTTTSTKIVEESYSISSQHEEVVVQSSSSQFSASSVSATAVSSTAVSSSSYQSSSVSGAITEGGVTAGSTTLSITELGKPVFTRTISGLHLEPGETAVFECQLESSAQVTWLKDNKALEDKLADRVIKSSTDDNSYRLELQHVHEYDTGIYTALAQNKEGSATCTAQLVVQGISEEERQKRAEANAPLFTVKIKDTELLQNTNFRFMVKVRGNPNPEVKFFKDGQPVKTDGDRVVLVNEKADIGFYELVIADVQPQDSGKYSCVATNSYGEAHCEGKVTVTDEKKVFAGLENTKLLQPGEKPEFSWLRDGKPFDPEERFKVLLGNEEDSLALVFQHVKPEDAGLYTCVAQTSTGKISCSAELSVQGTINQLAREPEKPKLTTEAKDSEVSIGGSAMLEAKILGFPKPQVKWYHDGNEVKASGRFKFLFEDEESMTLVIKNVVPEDAGTYKIVAKNELGEDTTEMKLTVKAPPKFKKKLEDLHVMLDEEMKVTVEVEGSPPPDIKWYKDGKELAQSDRIKFVKESNNKYSLVIQKAALTDTGSYSVVATNDISQSSEFFKAEIHTPPKFLKNMEKNIEVGEGGKIVFSVKVAADPPPKVRWLKDGVEIKPDGSKVKVSVEGDTHTLIVYDTKRDDSAEYSIELSNEHGVSTDKGRANVKCPPVFKVALKDLTANEGDTNVEFVVNVNAYPKPSIKWYLDETEITEKRTEYTKIEEGDNYKLIIKEVTTELKGKYTCKVVNDLGSVETSAKLTVNCKPRFGKTLQPKTEVDEGQDLTLQIECYGCPEPEIKWFKDGQEIHADAHIKITRDSHRSESYSMTLNLVKGTDTGDYEVKATNTMGSASTKSHVHVFTFPQISNHDLEARNVYESLSTSYFVDATGIPRPTATWYKDGKELKPSDKVKISDEGETYRLELLDLVMDDAGVYGVKISNRLGEKTQEAKLELTSVNAYRKPTFKVPLVDQKIKKKEETVHKVVIVADPIPEIVWLHNGKEVPPKKGAKKSESTEDIKSERPSIKYKYSRKTEQIDIDDVTITANVDIKEIENGLFECTYTLTIPQSLHPHTGIYAIKAKNKYGEDESSCRLDVLLKPEIENLRDITGIPYEEAEFESIIYSNPPAVVKWLDKNGAAVKNNDHTIITEDRTNEVFKLKFVNIGLGDGGDYTLAATNDQGETTQTVNFYVHTEVPTVVKPLEDVKALDYSDVDYHIRFNGVPKAQVKWFKDGKELKTGDRITIETTDEGQVSSSLSIKHFGVEDVGQYSVTGSNLVGSAESKSNLKMIQLPPTFGKMLPRLEEVDENDTLDLKCKLDGSPIPKVKWFKDGEPLEADGHVQLIAQPDGSVRLLIENVTPTDCGAYKLVAENPNGTTAAICAVAVKPKPCKPTLLKNLENVTEVAGEPLKLEAKVMAFPAPEIKWFKDGHPIRPSQAVNFVNQPGGIIGLIIDAIKPEDAGVYSVKISNRLGETSGEAKVEVQAKEKRPMFEAHLMPVSVVEGFPAKLEVKATGHPKPLIKWTHKGKEVVPDGKHIQIIDQPDGTTCLLLDKATAQDAGEYAAVAVNEKGEVSSKAELQVAEKGIAGEPEERPSFLHALRDVSVEEGHPLILSAPFIGNPIPDVSWMKDDRPISANERILLTCDGKKVGLEIKPSKLSDAGTYSVRLVSPLGEETSSAKASVRKVFQTPTFTQKFSDLQQLPSYVAKFPARIIGVPKPEVEWYFNDKPIKEGEKYHIKRDGDACCLYVRDCAPEDSGKYRCRAWNKDGEAECEAKLDVVDKIEKQQKIEPPSFLKKTGDCEVYKGMTARFTACATGYPEPEFEWFRGEDKIYPNDRVKMDREGNGLLRLTISGVDIGDVGKYRLRIFNPHGEDSCESELIYESLDSRPKKPIGDQYVDYDKFRTSGAPLPLPDKPIISKMTDRHLTLSWKPSIPHGPRAPVTYRVEMAEQPDGDWFTARSGIRSCACDIRNLEPFRDYKFRIRVENKYGISDPSPFAVTFRQRLEPEPPKFVPYLSPGIDFRPETSPYFPKDFDVEKPPHDGYAQAPRFLRQEHDTQYGVKNHNCNLFWFVYGYPKPKMSYTFNDEPIEMGGRYECSYTRNGQATLFINRMLDRDVGTYEAIAVNEHGEARQRVRLDIAEYPAFIQRPDETIIMIRKSGKITARVTGVPYPEIKWYKDWQPLAPSSRIKIQQIPPDTVVLILNDVIQKDEGLYSVSARNVAGAVSSSAMVHIEENEADYGYMTYSKGRNIKPKTKPITDFYDLGDELGRGTQGVTYHAVERLTGRNYAAKVMHGRADLKAYMLNELDILNVLNHRKLIRLQDSFEAKDQLFIILELAGGGELLDALTRQTFTTETEIASYIRQILWGLEYLHSQEIAHLGLTLNDLLLSHPGGDDLKICDFGLARRIAYGKLAALDYGMPEYVSPEIANGEGVSYPADLWSVGIITYILLSGVSPFKGLNDRETLTRIREGKWEFKEDRFCNISDEARDFISKLLVYTPEGRLDVRAALKHPWLDSADKIPADQFNITTDTLKSYYSSMKDWYNNASCRTWYRRRPLSGAFSHPSKMVYPPGHVYTPEPEGSPVKEPKEPRTWEETVPSREPLDYETGNFKSESHYQYGPDTYLLQLRDVDLPCRLRRYMKVAANRQPGFSLDVSDQHIDWRTPVIRERRRFTDVMDEEIDDERKARINQYGSADVYSLRRLRHELGLRSGGHAEAEAMLEYKREGQAPFLREKPQLLAIIDDQPAELSCLAVGEPKPTIQWFKNDLVVTENSRVKLTTDEEGRSYLKFEPALHVDVGIYKVVARNKVGQTIARTRVVVASTPSSPDSPEATEVSDTEILLRWKQPKDDGHSPVLCYSLQYKEADGVEWLNVASNIDHEFWLMKELKPLTNYVFRLSARNAIGWSEKGIPTALIKTKESGAPKIMISRAMKHLQTHTESGGEITAEDTRPKLNYSVEKKPIEWTADSSLTEKYSFVSELARGRFSVVAKGIEKASDQYVVAKLLEVTNETEEAVAKEFENLRSLRHERIVTLISALRPTSNIAVLVMEKLQGADILTYFTSRHEYSEQMVATVVTQVLDGLQYLHWRGLCHLDIQPDNIVLGSVRSLQIKIVDLGSAQRVSKLGTIVKAPSSDYTAPEILCNEPAFPQTDIWSLGVLTYVLLSGVSPFRGAGSEETRQNITFVRYRFEYLYKELTQEATRFLMLIFKRTPNKRPTVEECYEHRWLLPTEFMIKKRERAIFLGNRLKEYCDAYHAEKSEKAIKSEGLTKAFGERILTRSNSIQEELTTTF